MRLESDQNRQPDAKTREILGQYLNKAVALSKNKDKKDAADALDDLNFWHEGFEVLKAVPDTAESTIDRMAKDLKEKETSYDRKTKIRYLSDADKPISEFQARRITEATFATGFISAMTAFSSSNIIPVCAGITGACLAVPVGKGIIAKALKTKTPEEKLKLEEFAEIKHRQIALKMLKRLIKDVPDFSRKFDLEGKKKEEEKKRIAEEKKLRDAAKPKNPTVEKIKQKVSAVLFNKQAGR